MKTAPRMCVITGRRVAPRAKRDVQTASSQELVSPATDSSSTTSITNTMADYTMVLVFNIIMLFFGAISRAFSAMFGNSAIGKFFSMDQNPLLQEIPVEQAQQQDELNHIHDNQVQQRQQIEDLRIRIERIEARKRQQKLNEKSS